MNIIKGTKGNDTLDGTDESDLIFGYDGRDVLDGGAGNDELDGGSGNDTYLFGIGSGQDTVSDYHNSFLYPVNRDTIQLGNGIAPTDVIIVRGIINDLNIKINGTTDQLKLLDWFARDVYGGFYDYSDHYKIEQVKFADGTLWDVADLLANVVDYATNGNDYLAGDSGANKLSGLKGNDIYIVDHAGDEVKERLNEGADTVEAKITYKLAANVENLILTGNAAINGSGNALNNSIYGNNNNNLLNGGVGDDFLDGGWGNDTYLFGIGSGQDIVYEYNYDIENIYTATLDTIQLGNGIAPTDVIIVRGIRNLTIKINGTSDQLTLSDWFSGDEYQIEQVKFADGTLWDVAALLATSRVATDGNDYLVGNREANTIKGGAGNDVLVGGEGNDVLNGGVGNDDLNGGIGNDTYLFGIGDGQDGIHESDALPGDIDLVKLGNGIAPTDVTIGHGVRNLTIKINGTTDQLTLSDWFTSDVDKIEQVKFADGTLWDVAALLANLVDLATDGDDYFAGDSGANTLRGLKGNDIYIVDHAGDKVKEKLNEGADTIETEITYKLAANVENLTLTGTAAITGTGNALNNSIYGNIANNTLSGGFGDDALQGDSGNDILNGGAGNDSLFGGIIFRPYFKGGEDNDLLHHSSNNDTLNGGAGNDALYGSDGNDILNGGAGNDYLRCGIGNNILNGGVGDDLLDVYNNSINTGKNILNGGVGDDKLYGGFGNDFLDGGVGNDDVDGGSGNDILNGGAGNDELDGGEWVYYDDVAFTVDSGNDTLNGGAGDDWLYGHAGNDILKGGVGYDELDGGSGNDTLNGGADNDWLIGGDGSNLLNGGAGNDMLIGGVGYDLLLGGEGNDRLIGGGGDNLVHGGAGNDRLYGGFSKEILNGGVGKDYLDGGSDNDILNGGVGDDKLVGGSGNDTLNGGSGNDILKGGAGNDIFQLTSFSTDTIRDFSIVNDTIQLDYNVFTQLPTSGPLNPANFIEGSAAADKNDYVIYNKGTGELFYDADGSDLGAAQQIALLGTGTTHPALTFADFIVI